ncbi:MAG: ATP-binding cassette domain-containing protein [Nitrososphaerales archaeon]|nr:ATP-binding cassette domain-containing protein [Nitrososphaerales archaeon]
MGGSAMLTVENLKKYFEIGKGFLSKAEAQVKAVDGVSFEIPTGSVFAMVGESGCGKTTAGRMVLRLLDPTEGKVYFEGVDITKMSQRKLKPIRRKMQIIFQDPYDSLNPRMNVRQIVSEPLQIHGIGSSGSEREEMVLKVLELVELEPPSEFIERYPHELSGGQRQRVAIARALAQSPSFVVADEPVSMLDVSIRAGVLNLLLGLKDELDLTMLFITHDLGVARYISDQICVMYLGRIVEMGPTEDIVKKPLHPYTQALLIAAPRPDLAHRLTERDVPIKGEIASAIQIPAGCRFNPRCPYATDLCKKEDPPLREDVIPGHLVACHYAEKFA